MGTERAEKEKEVTYISETLNQSQIAICVDYHGLSVSQITEFRQQLREAGAEAKVIKNTLAKIAASDVLKDSPEEDLEQFVGLFEGPSLLIFGKEQAVEPAKVVAKFAKDNEQLGVKGAWFSDGFLDEKGVTAVSKMPSREETLAKLLSLLNTPAQTLLRLLNAPGQQLAQVLAAHKDKLS